MIELEFIGTELPSRVPAWCEELADLLVKGAATHPGEWARFPHAGFPGRKQQAERAATFMEHFRAADGYLVVRSGEGWLARYQEPRQHGRKAAR